MTFKNTFIKKALELSKHQIDSFGAQYTLFMFFAVIYYGVPLQFWSNTTIVQTNSSIIFRSIAAAIAFFLIFKDLLPENIKLFFPLYWYFVLMFCLPFISTYMLLTDMMTFTWFFLSIFLLSILVNWISFVIITFFGIFLAVFIVGFESGLAFLNAHLATKDFTLYTVASIIVIISLFLRNRDRIIDERLKAYQDLAGYIAHEIRKPLSFVKTGCEGWINNSDNLFAAYDAAIKNGSYEDKINQLALNSLKKIPLEFKKTASDGLLFIEMLLIQTNTNEINRNFCIVDVHKSIKRVIKRWQTGADRTTKIIFNSDYNFKYFGVPVLLDHILYELFRNSEYFADINKSSEIRLWCSPGVKYNEIHVRDNGQGIDNNDLKKVLKLSFTRRRYGTGIGLRFCKSVMLKMGGDINILSKKDDFTEVILSFPILKNEKNYVA